MTEQTFTLAVPPSVNNLFVTVGNRRVKSKTYAAWMQAARWQIAAQRPRLMLGAVANAALRVRALIPKETDHD